MRVNGKKKPTNGKGKWLNIHDATETKAYQSQFTILLSCFIDKLNIQIVTSIVFFVRGFFFFLLFFPASRTYPISIAYVFAWFIRKWFFFCFSSHFSHLLKIWIVNVRHFLISWNSRYETEQAAVCDSITIVRWNSWEQ